MPDLTIAQQLITGATAGSVALLGVALGDGLARRREGRAFRTESALALGEFERLIWQDDWTALAAALGRERTRLRIAGIATELVERFETTCRVSFESRRRRLEESGGNDDAIPMYLAEARRALTQVIEADLLRTGRRRARGRRARAALEATDAALHRWADAR